MWARVATWPNTASAFTGAALVVNKLIRTGYLWEKVRVQGGAYGAFCLLDRVAGTLSFVSYRDPNVGPLRSPPLTRWPIIWRIST